MARSTRTEAEIKQEIETGRGQLAEAVGELRTELAAATDIRARLGGKLPVAAAAAASAGFVLAGGVGATFRYLARRSRG